MSTKTIKIQAEQQRNFTITLLKFAVTLDMKRHRKVERFITYIKRICELDEDEYQLTIDGFVVPKNDRTKGLTDSHVYRLKIEGTRERYLRKESEDEEGNRVRKEKRSKKEAKGMKIVRKKKQEVSSSSESDDESLSESSQSSSDSSLSEEKPPKKIVKTKEAVIDEETPKKKVLTKAKTTKPIVSLPLNKKPQQPKKAVIEKVQQPQQESSSSSSSSESSSSSSESQEELPKVKQSKNEPTPTQTKPANQAKITPAYVTVLQKPSKNINTSALAKKNIIKSQSSSQSQPSDYQPLKKSQPQPAPKPKTQGKTQGKIPPALRNKIVKKTFDQHKENQWLTVQKQSLKKWQETNKHVCQPNNKIRFKVVQLDEERFVPIKSGWITAEVKSTDAETGMVSLAKVEQEGKPYREALEIPEHNMDELEINRLLASKEQIACFESQPQPKISEPAPSLPKETSVQPFQATNGNNSLQKFICGQVNYYFTDKNYNFDLFMQMHANRHPQKYLNLKMMLNFGKIKKALHDEDKLLEFLRGDEKYQQRTYEVDFERRLIRKKGIKVEPEAVKNMEREEEGWGPQHEENIRE